MTAYPCCFLSLILANISLHATSNLIPEAWNREKKFGHRNNNIMKLSKKCKCNLFTHGAPRSSKNSFKRGRAFRDQIGTLKCWFLRRGENQSTRRKTSRSRVENQQQTQPTYDAMIRPYTKPSVATIHDKQKLTNLNKNCITDFGFEIRNFLVLLACKHSRVIKTSSWYPVQQPTTLKCYCDQKNNSFFSLDFKTMSTKH